MAHAASGKAVCSWSGTTSTDPCVSDAIACPEHAECWAGVCVCEAGFYLREDDAGVSFCDALVPCDNVVCGAYAVCALGGCHCHTGYRLSRNGFDCEAHAPACGSINNNNNDVVSCFIGASCKSVPGSGAVCVCDSSTDVVHYDRDGMPRCAGRDTDPCGSIACLPGQVCEQLASGEYGCATVPDPCAVDNGGCGVGAHCEVLSSGNWQCACNEGVLVVNRELLSLHGPGVSWLRIKQGWFHDKKVM